MDVMAGIPGASVPERGTDDDGKVMWTSRFHLAGGEACSVKMKIDPADLIFASLTVTSRPGDSLSARRAALIAKDFLRNVAPEFDGDSWFDSAMATLARHPDQTPSSQTDRATFSLQSVDRASLDTVTVDFKLNR